MKRTRILRISIQLAIAVLLLGMATPSTLQTENPGFQKNRLVLLVEEGETIFLVPPELPIGTSGPISKEKFGPIGTFESGLLSGEPLVPVLIEVFTTGSAIAGPLGSVFSLPEGQIEEEHTAWLTISPEEPRFAAEFGALPEELAVVIVTTEGVITGGTRRFRNAAGTSKLYLKIEVPKNLSALPIARAGQFVLEFERDD